MQELNKSMEARLVKMDERMKKWGRSTSVMDNIPKDTEIPRQEVGEQCEENHPMSTQHAPSGAAADTWAGDVACRNDTTTSQDASESDDSTSSTETDAENDTIKLMLKHEHVDCSYPQLLRQPHGCIFEETLCLGSNQTFYPGSTEATYPGSIERTCPGSTEGIYPGSKEPAHPGSEEPARPGSKQTACPCSEKPACLGSTQTACPGSTERTCPGNTEEFWPGSEQNECLNIKCLGDKMTTYLENDAYSMLIPPTICDAPKSLLMEMIKKSEDNDTWKLDDFKKVLPSIDFHKLLAKDCHDNWLEQQLPQQRRLHPTMMEVNANEVIKWLDVIIIFPNHIFMPSGTIARWSIYMNFNGKGKKDTSTMAAQREVSEIPLAQVFLGRIVTRWRVRMDYKKYRKPPTFLDSRVIYLGDA
ncbi:hypothetical protein V6N13_124957 [Hibiscus sabdariffa]